jgi:predicted transcriptional regulator
VSVEAVQEAAVLDRLEVLGVDLLTEWDALVFLYRHSASLCTAAQIANLIGYDRAEIGPALQRLETLGLIQRSRVSQGIRFYRFSEPEEPSRQSSLLELMNLTHNRAGRLMLLRRLKRSGLAPQRRPHGGLRLA